MIFFPELILLNLFYRLKEFALPGIILRIPCMLLKCFMENKQTSHEMLALAKFIIIYDYFLDPSGVLETSHLMIILIIILQTKRNLLYLE